MSIVLEYVVFLLVCMALLRELLPMAAEEPIWQIDYVDFARGHTAWLEHISRARQQGLLGSPRLEKRDNQLCVVGLGRCEPVRSVEEGNRLLSAIEDDVAQMFTPARQADPLTASQTSQA